MLFGVLATLALLAVAGPVVFRGGAEPGNPSLLDRSHPAGFAIAVLVEWDAVGAALARWFTRART